MLQVKYVPTVLFSLPNGLHDKSLGGYSRLKSAALLQTQLTQSLKTQRAQREVLPGPVPKGH